MMKHKRKKKTDLHHDSHPHTQIGDHLLRVNGKSTIGMHFEDVCKLMAGASFGATVTMEVVSRS